MFPPGFDPLAVKEWALNGAHFEHDADFDKAFARMSELFPNAKPTTYLFDEDPKLCVLLIEPRQVSQEAFDRFHKELEAHISPPAYRPSSPPPPPPPAADDGWQSGDAEAWKKS